MVGDMAITWVEALCLTKSSFSLLGMLIFWAMFLLNASSKKLPNFKSLPNKKYLCWDNETWSDLCQKHTNTQKKFQLPAIFRDIAIRILVKVHFCESKLYKAKKCALLKIV